ncbi:MAG: lyase family protein, partial [Bacteroidota bacterium]
MKIWQKDNSTTQAVVEQFTVGRDPEFDMLLARYDVQGSLAHTRMLHRVGLLSEQEWLELEKGLLQIATDIEAGTFTIEAGVEDIHSQVELTLTRQTGEAGKKIHTGRSRNDQVAVDIKLFLRDELRTIRGLVLRLFEQLLDLSEQHKNVMLPGYTH